jgi:hypothetical protein
MRRIILAAEFTALIAGPASTATYNSAKEVITTMQTIAIIVPPSSAC